jgi:hypothetical protein
VMGLVERYPLTVIWFLVAIAAAYLVWVRT